ncbi:Hypothetical predicted protein [Podarcis lilfordi]|uniref:Uncharacterized protein n=1 Tax=Podarcis lilfordi TaxID=74358 RepID=A0AA35LG39_9SAUR|nr:Hypothetical predicted protein [Podarcis lilfordi]
MVAQPKQAPVNVSANPADGGSLLTPRWLADAGPQKLGVAFQIFSRKGAEWTHSFKSLEIFCCSTPLHCIVCKEGQKKWDCRFPAHGGDAVLVWEGEDCNDSFDGSV